MTVERSWDLQVALYARLEAALAGMGAGGADVPVYDHAPEDDPPLFVRIDGGQVLDASFKNKARGAHRLDVHVFERPSGQSATERGQRAIKAVMAAIAAHLRDWRPFPDSQAMRLAEASVFPDEDGVTAHGLMYFRITI